MGIEVGAEQKTTGGQVAAGDVGVRTTGTAVWPAHLKAREVIRTTVAKTRPVWRPKKKQKRRRPGEVENVVEAPAEAVLRERRKEKMSKI